MNIFSWNVNGIRAVKKKGFFDFISQYNPDILCLQETKAHVEQLEDDLLSPKGYFSYFDSPKFKKGYSGVAIYSKKKPIGVSTVLGADEDLDQEGRLRNTKTFFF
jgi:exodeoxyribonuclease-3